jgi:hypothetical protein
MHGLRDNKAIFINIILISNTVQNIYFSYKMTNVVSYIPEKISLDAICDRSIHSTDKYYTKDMRTKIVSALVLIVLTAECICK